MKTENGRLGTKVLLDQRFIFAPEFSFN